MGIYENIKEVASLVQKADNIELYRQILDIQKESIDLIEENRQLKNEIIELKKQLEINNNVIYLKDAYYIKKEDNEYDGPYCRVCWDKDKKLIRMSVGNYTTGEAACMVCNFVAHKILKK